jgi:nitroimidazol reductase NimA-like FMN-containing flavoprotein (pyridoxamine 5'-phosphate oxidase superfamily)
MDGSISEIRKLMTEQRFGVLCTAQPDGQPYTSLVAVVASEELKQMAFATLRATRKFENISSDPRVALLIDDRANQPSDLVDAATVTVLGRARELEGDERASWTMALLSKHDTLGDFLRSPGCAVVLIEVDRLLLVTQFQRVTELVVSGGVLERVAPEAR